MNKTSGALGLHYSLEGSEDIWTHENNNRDAIDLAVTALQDRLAASGLGVRFIDGEIPSGAIDGVNLIYSLPEAPNPLESLMLFKNGQKMRAGSDFTLTGTVITYNALQVLQVSDSHDASYRY
jgi:hypothetical protein